MVLTSTVFGKTEVEWSKELSETIFPGEAEYRLPDGTRIDILTEDACWEVEWCSHKVYESIGQALYYQASTGKQGGVILLIGKDAFKQELVWYLRCLTMCTEANIKIKTFNTNERGK